MVKNLLIIGGGPGGLTAALRAAEMGLEVTLVEKEDLGGVCLNRGCIPSKSLATASDVAYYSRNSDGMGIVADVDVDYEKVVSWSNGNIERLLSGIKKKLEKAGVQVKKSKANFVSSSEVEVNDERLNFDRAIIATGSVPRELPNIRLDHNKIINSADFFNLTSLPGEILILGAGYIGMELGTICAKLGSSVTIVEMLDQILPNFSKRVVLPVKRKAKKIGLDINLNTTVTEAGVDDKVHLKARKDDEKIDFEGDMCLVSVGRVPYSDNLGLDNTKVEVNENGSISVNERFCTEDSDIFAIGDVVGGKMLAHEAYREAVVAVDSILDMDTNKSLIPEVVFTDPQLARVGDFEEGDKIGRASFRSVGAAYTKNRAEGTIQLSVDDKGILKGGQIVGPLASELINEISLAIENELSARDLTSVVHAHPTVSEGIVKAAENAMNIPPTGW